MYGLSPRLGSDDPIEALRAVAAGVRKKRYTTPTGEERPEWHRVELHLSVAECKWIMSLVDRADFKDLVRAAA